ncbi:RNA polymerase sigma factor (plasmid) [Rhizobium bangladeshense]|uniref:RNA polymerase sigma factor n=1 Tax=Rhizobium bangladeshense TaxID=1138189 RepID=UPI001A983B07|nr:RNA polymerase sigma factor [Rhizobium bangladeshense]MBX4920781.1 RNA polymerase sigma factor [Rhizobium bangladeshense]MBX4934443.1 RNA polymerase sigma factor [Rhizobium bangladeshense]MBY3583060.1 RNA polymerase sigma factor [Rhizobium bangladeshense]QSY90840.1 RNA polymerase sigma factor [Rhizobium bangladeshense]QSY96555.1 RNA polymerase sigma factor [Rhizobium bangladeshense]
MTAIAVPIERRRQLISTLPDAELVPLAKQGDEPAIRAIVQRHNQRLFRTARAVIRSDWEAEDVVQAAYVKAFTNLATFRGDAELSTWLTRITLNEALGRVRSRKNTSGLEEINLQTTSRGGEVLQFPSSLSATDPESELSRSQARHLLEQAVDELPDQFRAVFVLRDVEGMSTEEAASYLCIKPETVKTRLHRARKMMRQSIEQKLSGAFSALFPFDGARCASMGDRVITALRQTS